jgi:hypothetical protein
LLVVGAGRGLKAPVPLKKLSGLFGRIGTPPGVEVVATGRRLKLPVPSRKRALGVEAGRVGTRPEIPFPVTLGPFRERMAPELTVVPGAAFRKKPRLVRVTLA